MAAEAVTLAPASYTFWRPLRNLAFTTCLTAVALTIASLVDHVHGFEILIVGLGWPHVVLGFIFFFGRVLKGSSGARITFAVLCAATACLWLLHYAFDITFLIYAYFIFHAFRDEIFIFFQTSRSPPTAHSVYGLRGVIPLLVLVVLAGQPQDYRQDIRRADVSGAEIASGWTLFRFEPVRETRPLYFYVQSINSQGKAGYIAEIDDSDPTAGGELRVADHRLGDAQDLAFVPQYDNEDLGDVTAPLASRWITIAENNRVGQTFTPFRPNLTGIWVRTDPDAAASNGETFTLHLASPPLLPFEEPIRSIRIALLLVIGAIFLFNLLRALRTEVTTWAYIGLLALGLIVFQQVFRPMSLLGYSVPMIFQAVVVFHYFSWYVFSYSKFGAIKRLGISIAAEGAGGFERFLGRLRDPWFFTLLVLGMNSVSFAGVLWQYSGRAPGVLAYGFDYKYFLYFLVFHVTFSFSPFARVRSRT